MNSPMGEIGASLPRIDAGKIVSGTASYSEDLIPSNSAYVAVLRSPHARARIVAVDLSAAQSARNVLLACDGAALAAIAAPMAPSLDISGGEGRGDLQSRCLAIVDACYVGQPVAAVVA